MTREETKKAIEVMQGYVDGKQIESRSSPKISWGPCENPIWNFVTRDYRIKPEPKVVPWTLETCPVGELVISKFGSARYVILAAHIDGTCKVATGWISFETMLKDFTLEDGSPCGTPVE